MSRSTSALELAMRQEMQASCLAEEEGPASWMGHSRSAIQAEDVLWRLQDSILSLPSQALQACNSCRVHTMLLASLNSSCKADHSDLVAVPAGGPILEDPKAIRPLPWS